MSFKHESMFTSRKMLFCLSVIFLSFFVSAVGYTQDIPTFEEIKALELHTLKGEVKVFYSDGFKERAEYLQSLATAANSYFQKEDVLGVKVDLSLAVLGPEDWSKITQLPYGISHILPDTPTAIVPASKDNTIANGILANKENMSEKTIKRLSDIGVTLEEAAPALVDFIAFHEIGHIYEYSYGISTWPAEKWLEEFVATYLAYSFMKENQPEMADLWEIMTNAIVEGCKPEHTTLADFEELYIRVGNDNYGWYQGRFQHKVEEIYKQSGISFIHRLKKSREKNPEAQKDDPFRLKELDTIFKGFTTWAVGPKGDLK